MKEGNNNRNLQWLLLLKRNKDLVLQIVKSIRSLRESNSLETFSSFPAFNKTLVHCKAKAELPSALTFPPSLSLPPKQLSLQGSHIEHVEYLGRKNP